MLKNEFHLLWRKPGYLWWGGLRTHPHKSRRIRNSHKDLSDLRIPGNRQQVHKTRNTIKSKVTCPFVAEFGGLGVGRGYGVWWGLLPSCPDMQTVTHKNFQRP